MQVYTETTEGLRVSVRTFFLENRSDVFKKEFFFAYFITLENTGPEAVTLLRRHWYIHDSAAPDYEVDGDGVVGEQPEIAPGGRYHYNSFSILKSFSGWMEGSYTMRRADGSTFEAAIPRFHLGARLN